MDIQDQDTFKQHTVRRQRKIMATIGSKRVTGLGGKHKTTNSKGKDIHADSAHAEPFHALRPSLCSKNIRANDRVLNSQGRVRCPILSGGTRKLGRGERFLT